MALNKEDVHLEMVKNINFMLCVLCGLPFPTPGDLPDPGIKSTSLASPALAGRFFITVPPGKPEEELTKGEFQADRNKSEYAC